MVNEFLLSPESICFTTRTFALANEQSIPSASRSLKRLARSGTVKRVTKGVWANPLHPYFTPLACVPILLGTEQGYISFLTALHRHGVLSQIPGTIQIATTGHSRSVNSSVGRFDFFSLKPSMMTEGVSWAHARIPFRIASPEKALIDTLYLATRKGRRFCSLPEVTGVKLAKIKALLKRQIQSKSIRAAILNRLSDLESC